MEYGYRANYDSSTPGLKTAVQIIIPIRIWIPLPKSRDNMLPPTPDVDVIREILDHSPPDDEDDLNHKP